MQKRPCSRAETSSMPRTRADIANSALRIFLHDMGVAYDEARGLEPFKKTKHFPQVREFFGDRCCYCAKPFSSAEPAVEDHLVPTNKTALGLHAWGNIVPACRDCNAKKQGNDWRDFEISNTSSLAPGELRRPLLLERPRALGEVLRPGEDLLRRDLLLERGRQRGLRRRVHHALGQAHRPR